MTEHWELREQFEEWAIQPPREWDTQRTGSREAWPGQYFRYNVQCAWEAWCAASGVEAI